MLPQHNVFQNSQMLHQPEVLERPADTKTNASIERHVVDPLVIEQNFSSRRAVDAAEKIKDRRLAGTIRSDQAAARILSEPE